jgi:hypothetical protein
MSGILEEPIIKKIVKLKIDADPGNHRGRHNDNKKMSNVLSEGRF